MQQNEDIYYIPVNFTDAGRVLGLFELRNCIEAAALAVPTVGLCTLIANLTPFFAYGKADYITLPACAGLRFLHSSAYGTSRCQGFSSPIFTGGQAAASH